MNTPYPATAYLTGFLRSRGYPVFQADLGIETILALFSREGLTRLFEEVRAVEDPHPAVVRSLLLKERYLDTIEPVIQFLQGNQPSMATQICKRRFLPEGPRFAALEEDQWAFGSLGITDRAKHLASLYLDDLADLIQGTVAPHFGLSRYAERIATSAASYDPIHQALNAPPGLIDQMLEEVLRPHLETHRPALVGITIPFPGNLYGALRAAAAVRKWNPRVKIALGGGFVNTELRELAEPRLFDFVDVVTLDGGERPLLALIEHLEGRRSRERLVPQFLRERGDGTLRPRSPEPDIPFEQTGTPTWDGLPLRRYLSLLDMLNPMHRLWSDGRWNKLTVAHGCYWKKCSFCDVGLDYISRYEAASAATLVDRIEAIVAETGQTGFHFVDEAAPPKARLADLALALLERGRSISWWGNIRFEKSFQPRARRGTRRERLHRRDRRAGGRLRPPAGADEEGRLGRAGGARDARLLRGRHPGTRLPDVRLSDRDRQRDGREPGTGAAAFFGGGHSIGLLASVYRHPPQPGGTESGRVRHHDRRTGARAFRQQ
ncbi:MAG: hypothetical protein MPW14_13460 [Candidatus Manganitrophus sp.]|nr:MAG: hypothetical protein MPW14_13460 [Candidatus Manganitrophus sp.]